MKKEISLVFKYILELDLSKWEFSSLLFATIMANLINLTQPFFLGKVIDGVTTFSNLAIVNNLLFKDTFFVNSMFFLDIKNKNTIEIVSKIENDIKKKFFNSSFKMSYKDFLINNDGKLLNIIEEDAMVFSNILYTLLS
ncbi:ABC transporter ATP-binding protein, partial [Enterococcus faecalis]|nr:ABC transporter ATP-binding protein [Enterococcus faecalis]